MDDIAETVLVAINKIGSLINGPVLGVFALGILTHRAQGRGARIGLLAGFLFNLYCWQFVPEMSWLWWNVFGFFITFAIGYGDSLLMHSKKIALNETIWSRQRYAEFGFEVNWGVRYGLLLAWFLLLTWLLSWF